ncbi:MAG TPA: hypothetical protein VK463_17860, partial [Desulfomonilaceae bacterium]|nr:hypothetical protein [Desulfomonilaceae bacterium]
GAPQCGQALARLETFPLHSKQAVKDIMLTSQEFSATLKILSEFLRNFHHVTTAGLYHLNRRECLTSGRDRIRFPHQLTVID